MGKMVKLRRLAHARAGDKGENNNVSLFPYEEKDYALLRSKVTAEVVKRHFQGIVSGDVVRYEVPSLGGFNFVLQGVRKGGVSAALDSDIHGKSLSFGLLELEIEIDQPEETGFPPNQKRDANMNPSNNQTLTDFIRIQRSGDSVEGLPLKDIRVIDLSTVVAAPFAATLLGDMGAEVIKIENPTMPDALRAWGVIEDQGIHPFWSVIGRNKYPVTINLKTPEGKQIFSELIEKTDVLIENMRPGTLDKLGFDFDTLNQKNPGLIIGKISGYGQTGPYAPRPGFGTLAEGFSGFTYLNAQPGGVPTNPPIALADYLAGLHLAFAVMVALRDQKRGERGGQIIDVSLYEPLFGLLGPDFLCYALTGEIPQPKGNELSYVAPRNTYRTKDGQWAALSCSAQKPFERLMECVGHPELITDPRFLSNDIRSKPEHRKVLNAVLGEWIGQRDLEEVLETGERLGITVGPIVTMKDIDQDPHYNQRRSLIETTDPVTGIPLKMPNVAFRMQATPGKIRFAGLPHGSANGAIFRDLLEYSEEEIERLKAAGAI